MTNRPFDQQVIPVLQRPNSNDLNVAQSLLYQSMLFMQQMFQTQRSTPASPGTGVPESGFVGSGFRPYSDGTTLNLYIDKGLGFLYDASDVPTSVTPPSGQTALGISDVSPLKPVALNAIVTFAIPTPDPVSDRYDIVECRIDRHFADSTVLDFFDTGTDQFVPGPGFKTFSRGELDTQTGTNLVYSANSTAGLSYKVGQVGAGVPPSTSAGYERIAVIRVPAAATAITDLLVMDDRQLLAPAMLQPIAIRWSVAGTDSSGTITLSSAALPPGWRVAIEILPLLTSAWRIWFIAGRGVTDLVGANCSAQFPTGVLYPTHGQVRSTTTVGVIDGTKQTLLATSVAVTPNIQVAVGQAFAYIDVELFGWDNAGSTWDTNGFPNPFVATFSAIAKLAA